MDQITQFLTRSILGILFALLNGFTGWLLLHAVFALSFFTFVGISIFVTGIVISALTLTDLSKK